jgi:hypothetical protein
MPSLDHVEVVRRWEDVGETAGGLLVARLVPEVPVRPDPVGVPARLLGVQAGAQAAGDVGRGR